MVVDTLTVGGDSALNIAPEDPTPPVLTALSLPSTINLGTEGATLTVSYSATDAGSGVAFFDFKVALVGSLCGVGSFDSDFPRP